MLSLDYYCCESIEDGLLEYIFEGFIISDMNVFIPIYPNIYKI